MWLSSLEKPLCLALLTSLATLSVSRLGFATPTAIEPTLALAELELENSNAKEFAGEIGGDNEAPRGRRLALDPAVATYGYAPLSPSRPANRVPPLRWGAGMRIQTLMGENAWLELGADAVVYPWRHLGLGITALQGRGSGPMGCETALAEPCGAAFRTVASFIEVRLLPDLWISPYLRGSVGVAWGDFTDTRTSPNAAALASRSELGLDVHYGASARVYLAAARMDGASPPTSGLGFGLQLGLNL